jgi:hypothetical protein
VRVQERTDQAELGLAAVRGYVVVTSLGSSAHLLWRDRCRREGLPYMAIFIGEPTFETDYSFCRPDLDVVRAIYRRHRIPAEYAILGHYHPLHPPPAVRAGRPRGLGGHHAEGRNAMLTEYPMSARTGATPLVADCSGLEPKGGTLLCAGCGQRVKTLYVTPRMLSRCGHCFSPNSTPSALKAAASPGSRRRG